MNPMIRKELRQRMRERRAWLLPSLYLLLLSGTAVLAYHFTHGEIEFWREVQGAEIGTAVFIAAAYTQLGVLLLIAPVFSAGSITIEKEQRTLAGLLTSLLTPLQIWWGKFVAALLFQALLLVSALPVLALAFAFGGVGPRELGIVVGVTLVILASISSVGLYCSSYFRRSVHATAVTYAVVIGLTVLTLITSAIVSAGRRDLVEAPLYLNPFYALSVGLFGDAKQADAWLLSLLLFAAIGCVAAALAVFNIARNGERA